jgi:hypothetical protein
VWSNRDRRTLLDKMLALLGIAAVEQPQPAVYSCT